MAKFTYYLAPMSKLNDIPVQTGNLIYCEDQHRIYLDGVSGRVCYDSLVIFDTELERINYSSPFDGFYFVRETKTIWNYYNGTWESVTEPPTNNVIFIPKSELPTQGEYAVLYICGTEMLTWDPILNEYVSMNSESVWHEI